MFRWWCSLGRLSRQIIAAVALSLLAAAAVSAQKKQPPETPVDLNVANIKELEQLPGVGPTTAKAIIDFRTKSGRFHRVNDLLVIRGISEAKLKKMRPYVTVGRPPAASATPPAKKPVPPAAHPPASASSTKPQPTTSTSPPKPTPPAHPAASPTSPPPASTSPN
jgi:competence protein ComEA